MPSEFAAVVVPPHYAPILGEQAAQAQLAWWTPERLEPAVRAGRLHLLIAEPPKVVGVVEVVGVCQTGELDGTQVIWKLYLATEYRGRSLGVELLRTAISALPDHAPHVDVEHFAGNTSAARFYEREGFEVVRTDPAPSNQDVGAAVVWRRLPLA